jgi:hypothetical protein
MGGRELIADLVGATGLPLNPGTRTMRVLGEGKLDAEVHFSREPFTLETLAKKNASFSMRRHRDSSAPLCAGGK